jgi:8-oxo-dGTP diphosphatase
MATREGVSLHNNLGDLMMKIRATVICEKDKQVLLVRKPTSKWALPGGKVEVGEAIAEAGVRELQEETGLNADQLLYMFEFETGHTHHHVFEASVINIENATPQNEICECILCELTSLEQLNISSATQSIIRSFLRRL